MFMMPSFLYGTLIKKRKNDQKRGDLPLFDCL